MLRRGSLLNGRLPDSPFTPNLWLVTPSYVLKAEFRPNRSAGLQPGTRRAKGRRYGMPGGEPLVRHTKCIRHLQPRLGGNSCAAT